MQTALSFFPENLHKDQFNEVKETKPSTQFQSIQNPLSKKDPGLPNFDLYSKCTFRKYFNKLQSFKTKQILFQLIANIQFPGISQCKVRKQAETSGLAEMQRQTKATSKCVAVN